MITFADDLVSENKVLTEKQRKKVAKFYKQLTAHLDIKFYDFGDITITIMKPKKRPKFMTKKEMKALAKMDAENACESLGLNRKKEKKCQKKNTLK